MMRKITIRTWAHVALFNLFLVACLGLLMRLKILLPLPWINQRFVLHAHSHFAFSGWLSQVLILCIAGVLHGLKFDGILPLRYNRLLAFNLFCSCGMLVSFLLQGYGAFSIAFSTLTIGVSFVFYRLCQKEVSEGIRKLVWWKYIRVAMIFNMLSCLGTFSLAWTMIFQPGNTELRLASVYFYLHFQYNGWFFFACLGLFHHWLYGQDITLPNSLRRYRLFALSCIPMYLLSINWLPFSNVLHGVTIAVALLQFAVFVDFARKMWVNRTGLLRDLPATGRYLLGAVFLALVIKFVLQTTSSIPSVAQLAFGLRPVVIAYLHLVLLGILSLFLLFWLYVHQAIKQTRLTRMGIAILVCGIVLNEFFLMIQGIGSLSGIYVGKMPEALVLASLVLVTGTLVLVIDNVQFRKGESGSVIAKN